MSIEVKAGTIIIAKARKVINLTPEIEGLLKKVAALGKNLPDPVKDAHFDNPEKEKKNQLAIQKEELWGTIWRKLWDLGATKYLPVVIESNQPALLPILVELLRYNSYGENVLHDNKLYVTLDF